MTAGLQAIGAILLAAQVLAIKLVLDAVLASQHTHGSVGGTLFPIGLLALAIAGGTVAAASQQQLLRLLAELVSRRTWLDILDVATSVGLKDFERPAFYDQLQRVQSNAVVRPYLMTQALINLVGGTASSIGLSVALLTLQPLLLPLLLISGVPLYLATRAGSRLEFSFAVGRAPAERLRHYLAQVQIGRDEAKEVRAFGLQAALRRRYDRICDQLIRDLRVHVRQRLTVAFFASVASAAVLCGTLLVIVLLISQYNLSLATAGAAIIAIRLLSGQITSLFGSAQQISEAGAFLQDLSAFVSMGTAAGEADEAGEQAPSSFNRLDVKELRYTYPAGETPALCGVDLRLEAGEVVALVGENGSGKSTLAKLLANLYAPDSGTICWDGIDVSSYQKRGLRRAIAVIFQDFVHFQLPARDNIAFGRPDVDPQDEDIAAAADQAGAGQLLAALPEGYDTILSNAFAGGQELSLGQWQRIAIARAFYREAPFVILDEPSASLDPRAEHDLFTSLRGLLAGRTVLFISHRLSTVRNADRIYVLAEGRVVEEGTHDQLIALGGHYAELFRLQAAAYVNGAAG